MYRALVNAGLGVQGPARDELDPNVIARAVLEYEYHRKWDEEKKEYVCYPVLKEHKIIVRPEYRGIQLLHYAEWDAVTNSSTSFWWREQSTAVKLSNGEWVGVNVVSGWTTWSNADENFRPACETGEGYVEVEIVRMEEESQEYLESEYGDENEKDHGTIEDYIEDLLSYEIPEEIEKLIEEVEE